MLTTNGAPDRPDIRVCRITDIQKAIRSRFVSTGDKFSEEVRCSDSVTILEGPPALLNKSGEYGGCAVLACLLLQHGIVHAWLPGRLSLSLSALPR